MAYYAALVSLQQLIEEIRHDGDRYDQNFLLRNKQIFESLHEKIGLLMASLEDYESKGDESTDRLEIQIRDAAHKAQDIIESQISNDIHPEDDGIHGVDGDVCPQIQYEEGNECQDLRKVEEEVDFIVEELMRIKKSCRTGDPEPQHSSADIGGSTDIMVGFDEHLITLKPLLFGGSGELECIPIVGNGGTGKTHLARNIFDNELIKDHFDIRVWVTVTQEYHIQNLLRTILNSMNVVIPEFHVSEANLLVNMYKLLYTRRYLIIMDNIRSTKVWDNLNRVFPDNHNGSRIMLTTRLLDVAMYVNNLGFCHQMQFLNEEQSWNLLREKVFGQEHCPPELEDSGKSIANSFGGLPLAIIVVAGILSNAKMTRYDWEYFAVNASSILRADDEQLRRVLSLNYYGLPHHLKPCFLYIGGFPEKYEISVARLIKLWVAEGFLKPTPYKSLEEVGEEYLKDLVNRNLVLITKKRFDGKFKSCSIHNLLRELCREIVCHENFFHVSNENGRKNVRRSCLYSSDTISISACDTGSHVRSVLCFEHPQGLLSFVTSLKLLRVLDALGMIFTSFPVEILNLFHLRYLALRFCTVHTVIFPPSISKLQSLQTIVVEGFISLPSQIWTMPQLRHVLISNMNLSPFNAIISGKVHLLENLQTLSTVENFTFGVEVLEIIPNLEKLKVLCTKCKSYSTWLQYCLSNIVHLHKLENLEIVFPLSNEHKSIESFPESFAFPMSLKKLSLRGCRLAWEDMTVIGSLCNLEILKLLRNAVLGEEWEPIEGEFLRLKFLVMEDLDLKYWRAEYYHFPCLEHLEIRHCKNLEEIPIEIGYIPTLHLIKVCGSKSASHSTTLIQEEQEGMGNDDIQVRVCHS